MAAVLTGLDRLLRDGPIAAGLARGARVALLAHAGSVDRRARHAVEALAAQDALRLVRLLAPEHGLWGHAQDMEHVADARDPRAGLPVISLYGADAASLRPRPEHLADVDAVICDLQDIGARYYTYVYTMAHVMEVAAEVGVPVVVLDRPNPIGGVAVQGPVLEPALSSFVGRYPLPVRHGMTAGELACLFRDGFGAGDEVRVVQMEGWRREMDFEDTGLPWVPPSPNMPTPTTARVYPGGCLIEGSELSEGRGTTTPFELVGAPWIDGLALALAMRAQPLPGALFRAASFRPMFHKHAGCPCGGVQVIVTDRRAWKPFETYVALLREVRRLDPERFGWRREPYEFERERAAIDLLLGTSWLREAIERYEGLDEMAERWRAGLEAFGELRRAHLLYA